MDLNEFDRFKQWRKMLCVLNIVRERRSIVVAEGEVFEITQGPDQVGHSKQLEFY